MPNDPFYKTQAWRILRLEAIRRDGGRCCNCGAMLSVHGSTGSRAYVDHIKNRVENPHLALSIFNLETLCATCHNRKGVRGEGLLGRKSGPAVDSCNAAGEPTAADHPWNLLK